MPTVPYTFANAPGGSSIPLEELDANFAALQGQLGPTGPTGAKGTDGTSSSIYYYKANTVSTSGDPGLGYLSWNSTTQIGSNLLNLSHQTSNVVDIDIFLSLLDPGQEVIIQDVTSSANYQKWLISGSVININPNATNSYFIVPVSLVESGGVGTANFPGNSQLFLAIASNPPGPTGPTGPSVTGPTGPTGSTGPSGVASPAGSVGQVQFNNSSVLGADSNLVWDNTNKRLGVNAPSPQYPLEVNSSGTPSSILGKNTGTGSGISGQAASGSGVIGISSSGDGVVGQSSTGYAGSFYGKLRAPNVYTNSLSGRNVVVSSTGEFGYGSAATGLTVLNTIADLRATSVVNGQIIYVAGYYNPGDGGGGYFIGRTGSTSFNDNGGTYITTAYGSPSTSVWIRGYYPASTSYVLGNNPMNVLYFGAYGDGTNASTTTQSIQNAINAVVSTGRGGTVYFPAGTYAISSTINITSSAICLAGDDVRASIITSNSATFAMINISGVDTCVVRDLTIRRSVFGTYNGFQILNSANVTFSFVSADNFGNGYYVSNSINTLFSNCRAYCDIGSGTFKGWNIDSQSGNPNASTYISNGSTNVQAGFTGTSYGIFVYGSNVKDVFIREWEFATGTYGIWVESTASSNNFDIGISGCILDTYYGKGIYLSNVGSTSISGCWVNPASGASSGINISACRNVVMTGNTVIGGPNYASNVGIFLQSTLSSAVTGNTLQNNSVSIAADTSSGVNTITGNSIYNLSSQGALAQIQIGGYRNSISSNACDGTATYAIQLSSGSNNNIVSLNTTNTNAIAGGGTSGNVAVNNI